MQDFENAVAAPTPGGAGGKAALNAAAATAAPTPRRALGELKTNANALGPAAAAHLGTAHPRQQQTQKIQVHARLQRPLTGKPPVAPPQQQQKQATGVTIQTASAPAAPSPSPSLLRLPPVERPAGMPLDQQLAAEEIRAQKLAHGAAQAICAGVPLSLPLTAAATAGAGRYSSSSSSSSSRRRLPLGPAAAAAAAARAFTVFGDDEEEDDAECCRPRSAPSTPPAESSFLGEDQGKEREREKRETRRGEEREGELLSFHLPSSPPPASQSTQTKQTDFAPSPPSLDDALASLELCADRASEGEGGDDEERNSNNVGEREGGGGASAWAVSPARDASAE